MPNPNPAPTDTEMLDWLIFYKAATKEFIIAVERLLDWMNGNDISADHETAQPDDFNKLCESLTKLKQMLG